VNNLPAAPNEEDVGSDGQELTLGNGSNSTLEDVEVTIGQKFRLLRRKINGIDHGYCDLP
jgi:hypothetical protein